MVVRCAEPVEVAGPRLRSRALAAGGAVAVAAALALDPAAVDEGPVICPLRLATGLPCPGCGLTRSWVHAVHGQWSDSLAANPFGVVLLAAAVALVVAVGFTVVRRRPGPDLERLVRTWPVLVLGAAWAVFAAGRIAAALAG